MTTRWLLGQLYNTEGLSQLYRRFQSCSLEYEYKTKLPSYEECMMAEPCKVKLDVEIHKAAAEKNMITM